MKEEINEENQHSQFKQKDHSFWIKKNQPKKKQQQFQFKPNFFSLISYLQH